MTTLSDVVYETLDYLHAFSAAQEDLVSLAQSISPTDTTVVVTSPTRVTRGIVQIDSELLFVESEDNGALSVPGFGRGFRGTVAASHQAGAMVTIAPMFPIKNVRNAILQTQQEVYPEVYAVKTATLTFSPAVSTYTLPADCTQIISVTADQPGPTKEWVRLGRWRLVSDPSTGGKAITLSDGGYPGRQVLVTYKGPFSDLGADGATLASCGHQESHKDLLIFGAGYRLLQFTEPARLQLTSAEAQSRGALVQPGSATNVARQVYAIFQQRLAGERAALDAAHPPVSHSTR